MKLVFIAETITSFLLEHEVKRSDNPSGYVHDELNFTNRLPLVCGALGVQNLKIWLE